jgi:hypothetical protein
MLLLLEPDDGVKMTLLCWTAEGMRRRRSLTQAAMAQIITLPS